MTDDAKPDETSEQPKPTTEKRPRCGHVMPSGPCLRVEGHSRGHDSRPTTGRLKAKKAKAAEPNNADVYPDVRYYEGDDPEGFREEMVAKFGFDPAMEPNACDWGTWQELASEPEGGYKLYTFYCPTRCFDAVYGSGRYPLGS